MSPSLSTVFTTAALLAISNVFMTFAWYGHLREMPTKAWWFAAGVSWLIASAEYAIMVPANRLGYAGGMTGAQLKIVQECVTLAVFIPFMIFFLGERWRWDFLWAFLCILGAVFFIFRPDRTPGT
ncbi:MAG: DMT family protein [Opitutales bacterium]